MKNTRRIPPAKTRWPAGSFLICAAAYVAFLAVLCAAVHEYAGRVTRVRSFALDSARTRTKTLNAALESVGTAANSAGLLCQDFYSDLPRGGKLGQELCRRSTSPELLTQALTPPLLLGSKLREAGQTLLFDYDRIFAGAENCSSPADPFSDRESTPDAVRSFTSCPNVPAAASFSTISNIDLRQNVTLSEPAPDGTTLLAAAGYLRAHKRLELKGSTVIIAGGDLRCAEILNNSADLVRLTMISATGAVQIEKLSGRIQVQAAAWTAIKLPADVELSDGPLPYKLGSSILGLRPAKE